MSKITGEIVVILSHGVWNFPCDYLEQISWELAKKTKVVVFNPICLPSVRELIFERKRNSWELSPHGEGIDFFPSFGLLPFQRFELIRRININLNFFLFRFLYRLRFGKQKPIFWGFFHDLAEILPLVNWGKCLIYHRVGQVSSLVPKEDGVIKQKDRRLLKVADYVFTNSPYALKYIKKYNKRVFLIPCGCAVDLFLGKKTSQQREIKKIKKPVLGLIGSIDHRLDFKIIYPLTLRRKEWNFVFIGSPFTQQLGQFKMVGLDQWLDKLKKLPNVYLLGQEPKEQLADFITNFDVCLIPYDISQEFVKGCNPMKLYEYLAMGKPVVSTPIEAVECYSPTVKIASDTTGFEKAIEEFLKEGYNQKEEEKRKKIALENSWEKTVKKIWEKVQ